MSARIPVQRTDIWLPPDPSRVTIHPFVPGEELLAEGESRVRVVIKRILAMPEDEVACALENTMASFEGRHPDLQETFAANYSLIAHHLSRPKSVTEERRTLIGAYFTHEYSVEAAALFNPSMVPAPGESGDGPTQRFVMSLRAVGEGHRSSVEFRTGTVRGRALVSVDPPGPYLRTGRRQAPVYEKPLFVAKLAEWSFDNEVSAAVFDMLDDEFSQSDLDLAVSAQQHPHHIRRPVLQETIRAIYALAAANYQVSFPPGSSVDERVLIPMSSDERQGIEDVRFVRFTDLDGGVRYYGTYTAFDGTSVRPQLITTDDFCSFRMSTLSGRYAQNKGMALFPRPVGGRYLSLSRWDRENTTIATSDNVHHWDEATLLQAPQESWELIQIGNCGSPIETPAGWLVITHGVGPMRVYSLGAILLDLDDPRRVIGRLREPLMVPDEAERTGYVPNVLYSCGGLLHKEHVILPYGCADSAVRVATIPLRELLAALLDGEGGGEVRRRS